RPHAALARLLHELIGARSGLPRRQQLALQLAHAPVLALARLVQARELPLELIRTAAVDLGQLALDRSDALIAGRRRRLVIPRGLTVPRELLLRARHAPRQAARRGRRLLAAQLEALVGGARAIQPLGQ